MVSNDKIIDLVERLTSAYEQQTKFTEKVADSMKSLNDNFIAHNATMTTEIKNIRKETIIIIGILVAALAGTKIIEIALPVVT